jgi:hypothetical protein
MKKDTRVDEHTVMPPERATASTDSATPNGVSERAIHRYDLITNYRCGSAIEEMEPSDDGEWVRYEEFEALLMELSAASDIYEYRAALCEKLHGNAELKRRERSELAGEARAYGWVTNELRAIVSRRRG